MLDNKEILNNLEKIISKEKIKQNEPMKEHTSLKIGGPAEIFVRVSSVEELKEILKLCKTNKIPLTIVGNGSNILVLDKGIKGIVIKTNLKEIKIKNKENENIEITVDDGVQLGFLAQKLLKEEITGFEELSGIPGTIGGAIFMNAGAYGKEIKDINISTKCMDYDGEIFELSNQEQEFEYRSSVFNKKDYIILETKLRLEYGKKEEIKKKMDEYLSSRKEKQPIEYPSAGSTFKRQEGVITAKLIDECGLKGFQIGGAKVSEKHAGFVINSDNATAKDVIDLIKYIKEKVNEKYGIKIKEEIRIVGEE